MHPSSSIRQARLLSASTLLQRFNSFNWVSQAASNRSGFLGCLKNFSSGTQYSENVVNLEKNLDQQTVKENVSPTHLSAFRDYNRPIGPSDFGSGRNVGNPDRNFDLQAAKENPSATHASPFRNYIPSVGQMDLGSGSNFRTMDIVREAIDVGDRRGNYGGFRYRQENFEQNEHFAHIKIMRNNTFVTVTDSNGNKKCGASAGVPALLGAAKVSKYASEAVAEYAGRKARRMGIKSVVVRVKGFAHFKKKKQAILSFREGFKNPIVFIEDVTRHPHNGCRLPKKRRI